MKYLEYFFRIIAILKMMSTNKFWLELKITKIAYGIRKINKNLSEGVCFLQARNLKYYFHFVIYLNEDIFIQKYKKMIKMIKMVNR